MGNLDYWDKLKRPPQDALKTIKGGRLSGMTDVSPMWRMQAMTEVFGPAGVGWYYTIDDLWTTEGDSGVVFANAKVSLYTKVDGEWSKPIPGVGGSQFVMGERSGLHNNDEGYKMATTDALSVAMKALGVAADIYLGRYDGSKYADEGVSGPPRAAESKSEPVSDASALDQAREKTLALLQDIDNDMYVEDMRKVIGKIDNVDDMRERYRKIVEWKKQEKDLEIY